MTTTELKIHIHEKIDGPIPANGLLTLGANSTLPETFKVTRVRMIIAITSSAKSKLDLDDSSVSINGESVALSFRAIGSAEHADANGYDLGTGVTLAFDDLDVVAALNDMPSDDDKEAGYPKIGVTIEGEVSL